MLVVPRLHGVHRRLLVRRWGSVRRLVEDAQHLRDIEVVVVVTDEGNRVSIAVALGFDAMVLVAQAEPRHTALMLARPWVPILVTSNTKSRSKVVFAVGKPRN